MWLDRGELDKIVERSARQIGDDDSDWGDDRRGYAPPAAGGYPSPRKKEGFLGRLFDFD